MMVANTFFKKIYEILEFVKIYNKKIKSINKNLVTRKL